MTGRIGQKSLWTNVSLTLSGRCYYHVDQWSRPTEKDITYLITALTDKASLDPVWNAVFHTDHSKQAVLKTLSWKKWYSPVWKEYILCLRLNEKSHEGRIVHISRTAKAGVPKELFIKVWWNCKELGCLLRKEQSFVYHFWKREGGRLFVEDTQICFSGFRYVQSHISRTWRLCGE